MDFIQIQSQYVGSWTKWISLASFHTFAVVEKHSHLHKKLFCKWGKITLIKFYRQKEYISQHWWNNVVLLSVNISYKLWGLYSNSIALVDMLLSAALVEILRRLFYLPQSLSFWLPPCPLIQSFVKETRSFLESLYCESGLLLYRSTVYFTKTDDCLKDWV